MKNASILLVEDEDIIAEDVLDTLTGFGYEVAGRASSGADAISMARAEQPDLVLMDINIDGEMDGIGAARVIAESLGIPIVFLTSLADDVTLKRAAVTDPSGYVLKPFKERELRAAIELALMRAAASSNINKTESPKESSSSSTELSAEMNEVFDALKRVPSLEILESEDLAHLARTSIIVDYAQKESLAFEGEERSAGLLVLSGRVLALKSSSSGKELIIEVLPPGDPFGLFPTVESGPHFYSLRAHVDSKVVWIPRGELIKILERYPEVYKAMSTAVFERLRTAHDLARALAHDRVETRIASALLALLPKFSGTENGAIEMTRQELGEIVAATSETTIRVTKAMERQGVLNLIESGKIVVCDPSQLELIRDEGL